MKNIKAIENQVLDEFKNIVVLDREGTPHPVPVIYANEDLLESYIVAPERIEPFYEEFNAKDKIRLPVIGLKTTHIGHNHIVMEGIVQTLFRDDMNQIIEQFHHTVELNDKILISTVELADSEVHPKGKHWPGVYVIKGKFTVEFRA